MLLRRRMSLPAFFGWFSILLLAAAVMFSFGFWIQVYHETLENQKTQLSVQAERIDGILTDAFDYTAKYVEFVGEKIVQDDSRSPNDIAAFIRGTRPQEQDLYITTTFDWVTPDKKLRVSSKTGVLKTPFDMSDRDYLVRTPQQPWTLQLSEPRYGGLSKQWIIPAGMGFTDRNGEFVGSITLGFALEGLTRRIAQALGPTEVRYLVFTPQGKLVLDSARENNAPPEDSSLMPPDDLLQVGMARYIEEPVTYDKVDFTYVKPVGKYPFVIFAGYPQGMAAALFSEIVLSRLAGFSGIAAAALIMLYYLRRRLVRPVMQLAAAADAVSRGEPAVMPHSPLREIDLLSKQLQKVSDYVQKERRVAEELTHKSQLLEVRARELKAANAEAAAAAESARRADRAKSEFLANMSHELRTPMNAVVGLTNIMLQGKHTPEKQKQYLEVMHTSAQHLMQLINDLLDIAKLEAGQMNLEQIPFDLAKLLDDVMGMTRVQAREKGIDLKLSVVSPPPEQLTGDPHRLQQVLLNLVSNAVKFTEHGGVTIELDCRENPVSRRWNVTIAVADTGIGIPQGKLETIFDKFTQADSAITRTHGGTGLGLSISKALVEMMGGTISAESTYGKGSRFVIEFPLFSPVAVPDPTQAPAPAPQTDVPWRKAHILLVEDHSGNITVATALFDICGYTYELARTGKEALAKVKESEFDVVLMDVQMPEMDGFEVTHAIRRREQTDGLAHLSIIGMTAHALPGDRQRCLDAGMDEYIAKPFDPDQLIEMIQRCAAQKERLRRAAA